MYVYEEVGTINNCCTPSHNTYMYYCLSSSSLPTFAFGVSIINYYQRTQPIQPVCRNSHLHVTIYKQLIADGYNHRVIIKFSTDGVQMDMT